MTHVAIANHTEILSLHCTSFFMYSRLTFPPQKPAYALVFGIDNYKNLIPLRNAVNDARAIKKSLEEKDVKVFYRENCTVKIMNQVIQELLLWIRPGDVVVVFFAGHGVTYKNAVRLVAISEFDETDYKRDTINFLLLIQRCVASHCVLCLRSNDIDMCVNKYSLQEKGARVIVSILDCCLVFEYEGKAKTRGGCAQKIGMDNSDVVEGSFVLYACQDNDKARDGHGQHGKKKNTLTPQFHLIF